MYNNTLLTHILHFASLHVALCQFCLVSIWVRLVEGRVSFGYPPGDGCHEKPLQVTKKPH